MGCDTTRGAGVKADSVGRRRNSFPYDQGIREAFRNISGVELCDVTALNLLQLAPGGHLGRFVLFTENAFSKLDGLYGGKNLWLKYSLV